jgi:hypothetical protein
MANGVDVGGTCVDVATGACVGAMVGVRVGTINVLVGCAVAVDVADGARVGVLAGLVDVAGGEVGELAGVRVIVRVLVGGGAAGMTSVMSRNARQPAMSTIRIPMPARISPRYCI